MLTCSVSSDFNLWSFEKVRHYLLIKNAGFNFLLNKIKDKTFIKNNESFKERIFLELMFPDSEIKNQVTRISDELKVSETFIFECLTRSDISELLLERASLPIAFLDGTGALPSGFYIRVSHGTTQSAVVASYEYIRDMQETTNLNFKKEGDKPPYKLKKRIQHSKNLKNKILVYEKIEKFIFDQKENIVPSNFLADAIKHVSKLPNIRDIEEEEHSDIQTFYQDIKRTYYLPSHRTLMKLGY